jgi:NADH:ubiquinone oxidoreductase subunit 5 (subunit L)/multisubunit Na+/H+ antiporter MnhA subunit
MISRTSSALIESFGAAVALGLSGLFVAVAMFGVEMFCTDFNQQRGSKKVEAHEAKRLSELISTFLAAHALIRGYQSLRVLLPMRGWERKAVRLWLEYLRR